MAKKNRNLSPGKFRFLDFYFLPVFSVSFTELVPGKSGQSERIVQRNRLELEKAVWLRLKGQQWRKTYQKLPNFTKTFKLFQTPAHAQSLRNDAKRKRSLILSQGFTGSSE